MRSDLILILLIVCFTTACEPYANSETKTAEFPFVKSRCDEPPSFLLDSMDCSYGFQVMTVTTSEDTIDLDENVLVREISLPIFVGAAYDSIEKAYRESFRFQRMVEFKSEYPYLDSFSIQIDTSEQICSNLFIKGWRNYEPTRNVVTRSYPAFIKNLSHDTVQISEYSGVELQILNGKNKWETILSSNIMCGTGVISYWIAPMETIVVLVPVTDGKYSRTMRVKLADKYSSSFQANCNYKY